MLEAARGLYAIAPEGFITARNQLAKELKAAGQAEDAATVAKLRRPRLAEWALNRLAHAGAVSVDRFAHATADAQRAQSAAIGGDPTALRAATTELRDALNAVADEAVAQLSGDGSSGEGQRDDVTAILRQLVATADPSPLVAGVVGSEAIVSSGEFFPGAPDPVAQATPAREKPPRATPARPTAGAPPKVAPLKADPLKADPLKAMPHKREPIKPVRATPTKQELAAVRAMARAERLGLGRRADKARAAEQAATIAVEQAQATLAERRRALKVAHAEARAAEAALAEFESAHTDDNDNGDQNRDHNDDT